MGFQCTSSQITSVFLQCMDKPCYIYTAIRYRCILNRPSCIDSGHRRSFILPRLTCSFSVQACIFQMNITDIRLQYLISRRKTFLAGMEIVDRIQIRPECFILKMFHDRRVNSGLLVASWASFSSTSVTCFSFA